jgi:hypothetical protein
MGFERRIYEERCCKLRHGEVPTANGSDHRIVPVRSARAIAG